MFKLARVEMNRDNIIRFFNSRERVTKELVNDTAGLNTEAAWKIINELEAEGLIKIANLRQ